MIGGEPNWDDQHTMSILALHNLAESYKLLPSEALGRANTFDLYVLDTHLKYNNYLRNKEQDNGGAPKLKKNYSQDELLEIIKRTREKDKERQDGLKKTQ